MEIGIHGETGIRRGRLLSVDSIVDEILSKVIGDLSYQKGDEVSVLVNGLGVTPLEEQYLVFRRVVEILSEKGLSIFNTYVGEYATAMEMAGLSISLLRLDSELKSLLSAEVEPPFFKQFQLKIS